MSSHRLLDIEFSERLARESAKESEPDPNIEQPIITITENALILPSGRRLVIDHTKTFHPTREFWALWHARKMEIKRAGVFITKDNGEYKGVVNVGGGINYTERDLHQYWREKAQARAETSEPCPPIFIEHEDVPKKIKKPCGCWAGYRVDAKICRNGAIQLRLTCEQCQAKIPSAIAWNALGSKIVIGAIAYAIQQTEDSVLSHPVL